MAISDTLSDASYEIRSYLSSQPSVYKEVKPKIEMLLAHMDQIRRELDTPPYSDPTGPGASVKEVIYK